MFRNIFFHKYPICDLTRVGGKKGIRSKSLLVASLSKSIFLTPGSSWFPKGINIWIMNMSHQSCSLYCVWETTFLELLTQLGSFFKGLVTWSSKKTWLVWRKGYHKKFQYKSFCVTCTHHILAQFILSKIHFEMMQPRPSVRVGNTGGNPPINFEQ